MFRLEQTMHTIEAEVSYRIATGRAREGMRQWRVWAVEKRRTRELSDRVLRVHPHHRYLLRSAVRAWRSERDALRLSRERQTLHTVFVAWTLHRAERKLLDEAVSSTVLGSLATLYAQMAMNAEQGGNDGVASASS